MPEFDLTVLKRAIETQLVNLNKEYEAFKTDLTESHKARGTLRTLFDIKETDGEISIILKHFNYTFHLKQAYVFKENDLYLKLSFKYLVEEIEKTLVDFYVDDNSKVHISRIDGESFLIPGDVDVGFETFKLLAIFAHSSKLIAV